MSKTFSDLLATGLFLAQGTADRDSAIRFARSVLGRAPKTMAEVDQTVMPFVEAGLLRIQKVDSAPKGCPGGRPRPALITRTYYTLTPKGEQASLEWKKANPERLTPWQRKVLGV